MVPEQGRSCSSCVSGPWWNLVCDVAPLAGSRGRLTAAKLQDRTGVYILYKHISLCLFLLYDYILNAEPPPKYPGTLSILQYPNVVTLPNCDGDVHLPTIYRAGSR